MKWFGSVILMHDVFVSTPTKSMRGIKEGGGWGKREGKAILSCSLWAYGIPWDKNKKEIKYKRGVSFISTNEWFKIGLHLIG